MAWHEDPDELAGELNSLVPTASATACAGYRPPGGVASNVDRPEGGGPAAGRGKHAGGAHRRAGGPTERADPRRRRDRAGRPARPSGLCAPTLRRDRHRGRLAEDPRSGALPDQPAPRTPARRGHDSRPADSGPQARHLESARRCRTALPHPARPGRHRRRHRLGQDDDARGAGRRDQPARSAPHRHDRRPDRVRTRPRSLRRGTGGDWRRCAGLPDGAPRGRPPGPGRHRRRRDARPGDDADCAGGGADGPPRADDDAHDGRGGHRGPHRGQLPAGAAADHPAGPGDGIVGGVDSVAAAAHRRAGASRLRNC